MGNGVQGRPSPPQLPHIKDRQLQPRGRRKELGLAGGQAEMTVGDTPTYLQGRFLCSLPGPGPTKLPSPWGSSHGVGC